MKKWHGIPIWILVVVVAIGGYFLWNHFKNQAATTPSILPATPDPISFASGSPGTVASSTPPDNSTQTSKTLPTPLPPPTPSPIIAPVHSPVIGTNGWVKNGFGPGGPVSV